MVTPPSCGWAPSTECGSVAARDDQQVELVVGNGSGHVANLSTAPNGIPSQLGRLRTS